MVCITLFLMLERMSAISVSLLRYIHFIFPSACNIGSRLATHGPQA